METREKAKLFGRFTVECWRLRDPGTGQRLRDSRGRFLPRQLAWLEDVRNIIPDEGLNHALNVVLNGATGIDPWYCCLVESDTTPAAGQTYATPVYTESTAYDEATRPEYEPATSTAEEITNTANKAVFTINDTKTMYGASIVGGGTDANTKGNTAGGGTLFCYSRFTTSRSVISGDVINLTYSVEAESA